MADDTRIWFSQPLETVAIWWRVERRDGVTIGFTSHDRDLTFEGLVHRTAPGMVPSAIRRSADFEADSAEITGALSHDSIREEDLAAGRFDGAAIAMGLVDWETLEKHTLYAGAIGSVSHENGGFSAELGSTKELLARQVVQRTSPTCRAEFCGQGCTLSAARYTGFAQVVEASADGTSIRLSPTVTPSEYLFGMIRWLDGPDAGQWRRVEDVRGAILSLDETASGPIPLGTKAIVRQGCDHTLETCATRFANAINFQGEPFLPGNDMLGRYPQASA